MKAALLVFGFLLLGLQEPMKSTNDGVYTADQARRGEKLTGNTCSRCHQPEFYKGQAVQGWTGNTVGALYESLSKTMPEDRPSSLKPQEYADIIAFMFELNEFPAGVDELPGDAALLGRILIERRAK